MHARVTAFDIDLVRISIDDALQRFKDLILPAVRRQPGYEGCYILNTGEGKGLLISLWSTAEAAEAGVASGYYQEQIRQFLTFYRQPPGREHYEVIFAESPVPSDAPSTATLR
jgi:heme-degrading monooxygenase HmoA